MDLIKILLDYGLEEKEAKVYLSLLKSGETTATKIAKHTNLDRTLIYQLANKLIEKGLVSYSIKNNVKYFLATGPRKLLERIKEKEDNLRKAIPDFLELVNKKQEETTSQVYQGKEGIKTVLREILRNKQDHLVLGEEGHFQDIFPIFFEQFVNGCKQSKIKEKIICSEKTYQKVKKFDYEYSKIKKIDNKNPLPTTTIIYADKIVLFNWELPYNAVVITNKNMAQTYRQYFEALWKIAKA